MNNPIASKLLPPVKQFNLLSDAYHTLGKKTLITVFLPKKETDIQQRISQRALTYWQTSPAIVVVAKKEAASLKPGAYRLQIDENAIAITSSGEQGVLHAMSTLRQLAEPERGPLLKNYLLPMADIEDEPFFPFRGIHLCWFPETEFWEMERAVRFAAYYKYNYVILEFWGNFPFLCRPELSRDDARVDRRQLQQLVELAGELGLEVIPQFNILGHASASRFLSGKHAVLDTRPELQPLFEIDGWSWCLSNPASRQFLTDAVLELYEFFGKPSFFHIGCDEADGMLSCSACRTQPAEKLIKEHILFFHQLLAPFKCRLMMWHDMLVQKGDPRWKGYIANGKIEHPSELLVEELPKDIIIADWQYYNSNGAVTRFFKRKGFDVFPCPWNKPENIIGLGNLAHAENLSGFLQTTWQDLKGISYNHAFALGASAAWAGVVSDALAGNESVNFSSFHLRQIGWDMGLRNYRQTGTIKYQIFKDTTLLG